MIRSNRIFLLLYSLLIILSAVTYLILSKSDGFILLNPYHSRSLDLVFRFITFLGDGIFIAALALLLFILRKKRLAALVISSYALSGIIAQVLKALVASPRPKTYFENSDYVLLVDKSTLYSIGSFPSGHTASAFALAAVLAFYIKNKKYSWFLFVYACLVGYSRIYLAQHFLLDVICGSLIGVLSAIVCWYVAISRFPE